MSDYLASLEEQAEILLKECPNEIKKLTDVLEKMLKKTEEDCKKKGIDSDLDV